MAVQTGKPTDLCCLKKVAQQVVERPLLLEVYRVACLRYFDITRPWDRLGQRATEARRYHLVLGAGHHQRGHRDRAEARSHVVPERGVYLGREPFARSRCSLGVLNYRRCRVWLLKESP